MTALYTLILVASKMLFRFHTFLLSRPKAALAFENLVFTMMFICDDRLREGAAKVGELFYHSQSLSFDGDVGLDVWFSRRSLVHHFCLFCADG